MALFICALNANAQFTKERLSQSIDTGGNILMAARGVCLRVAAPESLGDQEINARFKSKSTGCWSVSPPSCIGLLMCTLMAGYSKRGILKHSCSSPDAVCGITFNALASQGATWKFTI